jgi:ribosomal protein S18 acetylase RimI-like enzyme
MNLSIIEHRREGYIISTDAARLQVDAVHAFLTRCYWSPGIPKETVRQAMDNSFCIGLYTNDWSQVGLARAVTDATTFAYLCDVYVLEEHRGKGLGTWMVQSLLAHPSMQGLRRIVLITRDAHKLYEPLGFRSPARPEGYLEIHRPKVYT